MKQLFSLGNVLEGLAVLMSVVAGLGVLHTFIIGKHFVIPTMMLLLVMLFGNLARFGLKGPALGKHMLFWIFLLAVFHALFAIVWAPDARPGQLFGDAFYPSTVDLLLAWVPFASCTPGAMPCSVGESPQITLALTGHHSIVLYGLTMFQTLN